jgi:hypothetical protein
MTISGLPAFSDVVAAGQMVALRDSPVTHPLTHVTSVPGTRTHKL